MYKRILLAYDGSESGQRALLAEFSANPEVARPLQRTAPHAA